MKVTAPLLVARLSEKHPGLMRQVFWPDIVAMCNR